MKISIVTASKNAAATIRDTLLSIESQTHADVEHVVVDGVSSDNTLEIVRQHGQRVAAVVSEKDSGVYAAFNRGLAMTSGEVVAFLNADDVYAAPDVLARVARHFTEHDVDIVFGDVLLVRADDLQAVVRYYSSRSFEPMRLARGFMPAHPATFVRRSIYERYGGFNPTYRIAGDFEWVARVFHNHSVRFDYMPDVLVRMREGGLSTRGLRTTLRITREIRRACREQGVRTNYMKLLSRFPEKLLEYVARPDRKGLRGGEVE